MFYIFHLSQPIYSIHVSGNLFVTKDVYHIFVGFEPFGLAEFRSEAKKDYSFMVETLNVNKNINGRNACLQIFEIVHYNFK